MNKIESEEEEEEEDEEEVKRTLTKTFEAKLERRRGGRHGKSLKTLELQEKGEEKQGEEVGGVEEENEKKQIEVLMGDIERELEDVNDPEVVGEIVAEADAMRKAAEEKEKAAKERMRMKRRIAGGVRVIAFLSACFN